MIDIEAKLAAAGAVSVKAPFPPDLAGEAIGYERDYHTIWVQSLTAHSDTVSLTLYSFSDGSRRYFRMSGWLFAEWAIANQYTLVIRTPRSPAIDGGPPA